MHYNARISNYSSILFEKSGSFSCFSSTLSPSCILRIILYRLRVDAIDALQSFILPDGTDYSRGVLFGRAVAWAGASALAILAAPQEPAAL